MRVHLVVAYETASSPELAAALRARASAESDAGFVLIVPATPRRHLLSFGRGRDVETAAGMAVSARAQLKASGVAVLKAVAGKANPIDAIADELATGQEYASIIISTHPADVSRWVKAKVTERASEFGLPVTHIAVKSVAQSLGLRGSDTLNLPGS